MCQTYNTTIYLFAILFYSSVLVSSNNCSVDFYNDVLFFRQRSLNHTWFLHTKLHTRLTEFQLTVVLTFYIRPSSVWWRFLKSNVEDSYATILLCAYPFDLMRVVVGLLRTSSKYLLSCFKRCSHCYNLRKNIMIFAYLWTVESNFFFLSLQRYVFYLQLSGSDIIQISYARFHLPYSELKATFYFKIFHILIEEYDNAS